MSQSFSGKFIVSADIGGTNGRFAVVDVSRSDALSIVTQKTYACAEFDGLDSMMRMFLKEHNINGVQHARLALAGQTSLNQGGITNIGWSVTSAELENATGLSSVTFMNDFAAVAYAVPHLEEESFMTLKVGAPHIGAPISVMGPGTGFGVAQIIYADNKYHIVATEGGHIAFAPSTHLEHDLWAYLKKTREHICLESLLSGRGLARIHEFLVEYAGSGPKGLTPEEVSTGAVNRDIPSCVWAVQVFLSILGSVSGDFALAHGARGGVWLAGGIIPKIFNLIDVSDFRKRFGEKGIMSSYLADIPINLITDPNIALVGAAAGWVRENNGSVIPSLKETA